MHIPDGFISAPVAVTGCVVAAGCVAYAVKATNKKMGEKQVPLMGVLAAFIFAAQMLNFPIAGGTSGHLIGAALAAILLGPWAGMLIMTCVLVVQCLVFQDGGLLALGANIVNMGIIATFISYYVYRGGAFLSGGQKKRILVSGGLAAWLSVVVAAVACVFELVISGTVPLGVALPAMGGIHALIGIAEGAITAGVLSLIMATRADLLSLAK
ncbi:MAG: cobalamin biosynthesis protein CbiM [Chloroflexi bacterium CG23_combo_of_CG06-09_8_20_14_all_45_10]|nr:MAG: cobalamin biosynthesis protein CbiM [Chloroflexi bacterium CG23_combo_of_CG06-09_8_20_14_all_45_10]